MVCVASPLSPAALYHHTGGTSQKRPNRRRSSSHCLINWSSPTTHQAAGLSIVAGPLPVVEEEGAGHNRVGEEPLRPPTSCGLLVTSRPSAGTGRGLCACRCRSGSASCARRRRSSPRRCACCCDQGGCSVGTILGRSAARIALVRGRPGLVCRPARLDVLALGGRVEIGRACRDREEGDEYAP
jgi:hypothetical protein